MDAGISPAANPGYCCGPFCCAQGLNVDFALWLAMFSRSVAGPSLLLGRGPPVRGCQVGCGACTSRHLMREQSLLHWRLAVRWLRCWKRDSLTVLTCACSKVGSSRMLGLRGARRASPDQRSASLFLGAAGRARICQPGQLVRFVTLLFL